MQIHLENAERMEAFGADLAKLITNQSLTIWLEGELGAGKTTLVRGLLHGRGYVGNVKSPTYTLVEPYELASGRVAHFDLYRIADPEELDFIGLRDYLQDYPLCLFEWPEKAAGMLPEPDIRIQISYAEPGRNLLLIAGSKIGEKIINKIQNY
jgi:tRNA threonylcarbamoyladenosine biosynthesis protein TsaE